MTVVPRRKALGLLASLSCLVPSTVPQASEPFPAWLAELRREAAARGIRKHILDTALEGLEPIPRVIELDRQQPEGRLTFAAYRERVVTAQRIRRGRELLARHHDLLQRVEARYRVPAHVIVTLWGIESNFGERPGTYSVIAALATLAHDGRRARFFRGELLSALTILDQGHIAPDAMKGSWAGAMGQCQFMPSTFLGHAVDFDGDGRRDIWRSLPDVFASAANYLARSGWDGRYIWGRRVRAPRSLPETRLGLDHRADLAEWRRLGVSLPDGGDLPLAPIQASLLCMDERPDQIYLVYGNFRALMAWNRSTYFGLAVGLLSDSLRDG